MNIGEKLEALESRLDCVSRRLAALETGGIPPVLEMDLVLPSGTIGGLRFNETKVRAVFTRGQDGWYHSRDILFLSARNIRSDNSHDTLAEDYLNEGTGEAAKSIREQIAESLCVKHTDIAVSLPKENEGVKEYCGVPCWYWLAGPRPGSSASFLAVADDGHDNGFFYAASAVGGAAPVFRVGKPA